MPIVISLSHIASMRPCKAVADQVAGFVAAGGVAIPGIFHHFADGPIRPCPAPAAASKEIAHVAE